MATWPVCWLTVKPLDRVPLCILGLVTTTFHVPGMAEVIGQLPDERVVELVKVKPVQFILDCPLMVSATVAPDTKLVPLTEVIEADPELTALVGLMAVTVGARSVTVKPPLRAPNWVFGLVTTTFHAPDATPLIGQVPRESVVELVRAKPVQTTLLCPLMVSWTVAPEAKLVPDIDVMDMEPLLLPLVGDMDTTVGAFGFVAEPRRVRMLPTIYGDLYLNFCDSR